MLESCIESKMSSIQTFMSNKIILLIVIHIIGIFIAGCSDNSENQQNSTIANSNIAVPETTQSIEPVAQNATENIEITQNTSCGELKKTGFALDKKQTFAVDFAPFEKSCFATFHDPEFTNPALGAQYFIYKNGREVFNFPEQFNGGNATCRVDAVSFEDVNGDKLKDIIVIGKCGAKSDDYNENMVYINTGKDFKVNKDANIEMMDFSKVSQIQNYVREHQKSFAK